MIQAGFIGYGSMGRMLLQGFIDSGAIAPEEIIVSTRTKSKLREVRSMWPGVRIADGNSDVARQAKYIFICVKPLEVKNVLQEIKGFLTPDSVVISIAGAVSVKNMENLTHVKVIRVIPTVVSEAGSGISLICPGNTVGAKETGYIESLMGRIGKVRRISEEDLEFATRLTSCGPGLLAAVLGEFAKSAARENGSFSAEDIEDMVTQTFYGTAKLLAETNMTFGEMVERVATKGGTTEEGVKVFRSKLPEVFDKAFIAMESKQKAAREKVDEEFIKR